MSGWTVFCDDPSLTVELARHASALGVVLRSRPHEPDAMVGARTRGESVAWVGLDPLPDGELAALALVRSSAPCVAMALRPMPRFVALASALGIVVLDEIRPLASALALLDAEVTLPFQATDRALEASDRRRLDGLVDNRRGPDALVPDDEGGVALVRGDARVRLGEARDVARALGALREVAPDPRPAMPRVDGVEPRMVLDVILGPARELSDPASKAALAAYDVPLPLEEVCASPSRAASEAGRIGFPVRIALASPDLRVWDHPDLVAEGVENAARARDVFRQVMGLARAKAPEARLLGVTVSATSAADAVFHVDARSLADGLALAELTFADPHGLACADTTCVALPCTPANLERAIGRLAGASLVLGGGAVERRRRISAIGDALLRVGAFLQDWRSEVAEVRLRPLAVLVDGAVEIREASVVVTDAFERRLR